MAFWTVSRLGLADMSCSRRIALARPSPILASAPLVETRICPFQRQAPAGMQLETLERAQFFPKPLDEVWTYFTDIENLDKFTPPFFRLRILTPERPELYEGQRIDYTLSLFGLPFAWTTHIDEVNYPKYFVDSQARGPYKHFRHTHEFWPSEEGTLMIDRLEFKVGWGPIGWLVQRLVVRPLLERIFDHRCQECQRVLG